MSAALGVIVPLPAELPRTTRAAVMSGAGEPVEVTELALTPPRPGEVLVRMGASGVCQSDLSVWSGSLPNPMPMVLGHEGAGTVAAVGDGVSTLVPGDHVVLSWLAQCGHCFYCLAGQPSLCESASSAMLRGTLLDGSTRYALGGTPVHHMAGLGTFSEYCVVPAAAAVPVPAELDITQAALLGCGVLTRFGAAVNAARVAAGESVAVLGCGGVGLNAIQGAQVRGARQIIAVDLHAERRDLARQPGATLALAPGDTLAEQVRDVTGGRGVDVAIEVAGRRESVRDSVRITRRGGRVVLVGAGPADVRLDLPAFNGIVITEKMIIGSFYGSCLVQRDVRLLTDLYAAGRIKLGELITQTFPLDDIAAALDYCAAERGGRAVVAISGAGG
jgi:Zn-dependent alcohol dehydrogenase